MGLEVAARAAILTLLIVSTACVSLPTPSPADPSLTSASPDAAPASTATSAPAPTATDVPPSPTPELAALVNGQPIYLADYERELSLYKAAPEMQGGSSDHSRDPAATVLNMMIRQTLMEQAAAEAGVTVSSAEVDAEMQKMIEESGGEEAFRATLKEWGYSYQELRQKTRQALLGMKMTQRVVKEVPERAEQVHARHILVDTRQEAEHLHAQLEAGADFAALAKAHSQDKSTREEGGDLGFFPRGILVAREVEEAAFALQPGQFSDVITSSLGYHIVQVVERDPARAISPEDLRLLQDQAVQEWIDELWAQAEIQRFVETSSG